MVGGMRPALRVTLPPAAPTIALLEALALTACDASAPDSLRTEAMLASAPALRWALALGSVLAGMAATALLLALPACHFT
jgi:hypothetical protein